MMNEKGVISGGQRGVECYEIGGKVGKNTGAKTCNGNNLAKLNDAKRIILCSQFTQKAIEKKGNTCVLLVLRL